MRSLNHTQITVIELQVNDIVSLVLCVLTRDGFAYDALNGVKKEIKAYPSVIFDIL